MFAIVSFSTEEEWIFARDGPNTEAGTSSSPSSSLVDDDARARTILFVCFFLFVNKEEDDDVRCNVAKCPSGRSIVVVLNAARSSFEDSFEFRVFFIRYKNKMLMDVVLNYC